MKYKRYWKDLDEYAKKWLRGWVVIMDKDMNQKIVHSSEFDDNMIFYYPLPQWLTREQFEKTTAAKEINVDWENNGFIIQKDK